MTSKENVRFFTADDLLQGFLELRRMSPDMADWNEKQLADKPYQLKCHRRLKALFQAFGIPYDPFSFASGSFIDSKSPGYTALLKRMAKEMPLDLGAGIEREQLQYCFRMLFDYGVLLDQVLTFSSGVMEASGLYLFAHLKVQSLNRVVHPRVPKLDKALTRLICPKAKSFSMQQLVWEYKYPDPAIDDEDDEW